MALSLRARILLILVATAAVSVVVSFSAFIFADGQLRSVRDEMTRTTHLNSLVARLDGSIDDEYGTIRDYVLALGTDEAIARQGAAHYTEVAQAEQAAYLPDDAALPLAVREDRFAHWLFPDPLAAAATSSPPNCTAAFDSLRSFCLDVFGPTGVVNLACAFRGGGCDGQSGWVQTALAHAPSEKLASTAAVALLKQGQNSFGPLETRVEDLQQALGAGAQDDIQSRIDRVTLIQTGFLLVGIAMAIAMLLFSSGLLNRWVARPLRSMVAVARRVEAGEEASFGADRSDEIGQLGHALETMRARMHTQREAMAADAKVAGTINRFTEAAAFVEDEHALAAATLEALTELSGASDALLHVTTVAHDKAVMVERTGDAGPRDQSGEPGARDESAESRAADISIGALDNCPGVRRGSLYTTPDLEGSLSIRCPVYQGTHGALACIPLAAAGEVLGVAHLHWAEPRTLPLATRTAIGRVTDHAGMTIANRRLLSALRGQSLVDPQTGLMNGRAFDQALERAMAGRRSRHELALLLIDVDDFSSFNDRNGTPAGDDALRFFARTLNGCLRDGDAAARYGAEEFVVLLPDMKLDQAIEVAERIRQKTEATVLPVGRGTDERITVSIGVAIAPADGSTRVEILRAADVALYEAKAAGRNRVQAAAEVVVEDDAEPNSPTVQGHMIAFAREIESTRSPAAPVA